MNHTPNIRKSSQTFVSVLQKAKDWFASLSKTEQQNLIDDLEHGAALLSNTRQLNAYIAKYGEIHQAKLLHAYGKIPSKVWHEDGITVVDYGCGQGLPKWFFQIIWHQGILTMTISKILSLLNHRGRIYNVASNM